MSDPDPHQHEKWDPDPHQNVLDPPHCQGTRLDGQSSEQTNFLGFSVQALQKVVGMDGFWYDRLEAGSLAWGQIKNIKEVSLASLLCQNLRHKLQVSPLIKNIKEVSLASLLCQNLRSRSRFVL